MTDNVNVNAAPAPVPSWINADGLLVKFGRDEADLGRGGEYSNNGWSHVSEIDILYTVMALGTDGTHNVIFDYNVYFPAVAVIERCEFHTTIAWDSTSNDVALNFGMLARPASGSTGYVILDADGLMDSVAKSVVDLAGNVVVTQPVGSYPDITTYTGAVLGAALSSGTAEYVVSGFWETHVPTTGGGKLRLYWRDTV